jgi:hypothetical protein
MRIFSSTPGPNNSADAAPRTVTGAAASAANDESAGSSDGFDDPGTDDPGTGVAGRGMSASGDRS